MSAVGGNDMTYREFHHNIVFTEDECYPMKGCAGECLGCPYDKHNVTLWIMSFYLQTRAIMPGMLPGKYEINNLHWSRNLSIKRVR